MVLCEVNMSHLSILTSTPSLSLLDEVQPLHSPSCVTFPQTYTPCFRQQSCSGNGCWMTFTDQIKKWLYEEQISSKMKSKRWQEIVEVSRASLPLWWQLVSDHFNPGVSLIANISMETWLPHPSGSSPFPSSLPHPALSLPSTYLSPLSPDPMKSPMTQWLTQPRLDLNSPVSSAAKSKSSTLVCNVIIRVSW